MLQNIGDKIKGWVAGVVIALIGASFMLWGVGYYFTDSGHHNETVATVNGKKIGKNELANRVNQLKNVAALEHVDAQNLQQLAIAQLVNEQLWLSLAVKSGFAVDDRVMGERIAAHPSFQVNGVFSSQRFNQFLYQMHLTPGQFGAMLRQQMLVSDLNRALQESATITSAQLNVARQLVAQKRDVRYIMIDSKKMHDFVKKPDQKMIQAYYSNHEKDFYSPEKVKLSYLVLSPKVIQSHIHVSDDQVKQAYLNHSTSYMTPKQWKVDIVRTQDWSETGGSVSQESPQSLQKFAKALSSGQAWGEAVKSSGLIKKQALWSALAVDASTISVLNAMKKGEVSAPFKTPMGWQMVRLNALVPAKRLPFSKVEAGIKKSLVANALEKEMSVQADLLSNETYTNPSSLKAAADKLSLEIHESPWLEKGGTKQVAGKWLNPSVLKAAFSDQVLRDGNNSEPITLKDGSLVVLRVREHQVARLKSVREVTPEIVQVLTEKNAHLQANLLSQAIKAQLMQKKPLNHMLTKYQLSWKSLSGLQLMHSQSLPNGVQEAVFTAQAKLPSVVIAVEDDGKIYVVEILKVSLPAIAHLDQAKNAKSDAMALESELLEQKNRMFSGLLQRQLYDGASIKFPQLKR